MQSATEHDENVQILFELLLPGTGNNFNTYGYDVITNYDIEYDYGSVMHYSKGAFSVNGSDTIIPIKDLEGETMGQRLRMSKKDIKRLNRRYCEDLKTTTPATTEIPPSLPSTTINPTEPPSPRLNLGAAIIQNIHSFANNLLSNISGSYTR